MTVAAVSLGSNLGDRRQNLLDARTALEDLGAVVAVSPVYRTAPVGVEGHPDYLNAIVLLDTDLSARQLLRGLLAIEQQAGRVRGETPLPRTVDLDVVLFGEERHDEEGLVVPHPRMLERRFVLQPLSDVWPDAPVPGGRPLREALEKVSDQELTPADRGSWWVGVQAVVAAVLLAAVIWDVGSLGLSGSWFQWVGRGLVALGAVQAILGLRHLGRQLTAFPEPIDSGVLVTEGIYGAVRHPLYGANVLLLAGLALHQNSVWAVIVAAAGAGFYGLKAVAEERRLQFRYPGYAAYQDEVRARLIPFVV